MGAASGWQEESLDTNGIELVSGSPTASNIRCTGLLTFPLASQNEGY